MIGNSSGLQTPLIEEGIQWTTERVGSPSILKFSVVKEGALSFQEGDAVRMNVDGQPVFFGFVFEKKRSKGELIQVICYDQLRYLKNKDTYVYEDKTASQVIQMIAADFGLNVGSIESTKYLIPSRVEDNQSLFDIIQNALDLELQHTGELFCLYDDFGKLTLKNIASMTKNILIDADVTEDFDYSSSIDKQTYNQVKLIYDNEESGSRDVFIAKSGENINEWGVLQYFDKLQKGENGEQKANALLNLYNKKTRTLKINNTLGNVGCRAGVMPVVSLALGDMNLSNRMIIEKAVHTFNNEQHLMTVHVRGGEFIV